MQPVQVRMARAALSLSVDDLAVKAGVPASDLRDLEEGKAPDPAVTQGLSLFFASSGIELIDSDAVRASSGDSAKAVAVDELTTGNDGGQG